MFRNPHLLVLLVVLPCLAAVPGTSPPTPAERIRNMTPAEKEQLQVRHRQFESLSEDEQQRLRDLHQKITTAPDSEQLLQTMARYHNWLKSLNPDERTELLSLSNHERIGKIQEMLREQEIERFQQYAESRLAASDMEIIERWLGDVVARHPEQFAKLLLQRDRERFLQADRRWQLIAVRGAIFQGQRLQAVDLPLEDFDELADRLSPTAQQALAKVTEPERRSELIRTWVRAAVLARMREWWKKRYEVEPEELAKFRQQLSPEEQEWVDNLEPNRMRGELTRLYHERRDQRNGNRPRGFPGRGPGPQRPGPDRPGPDRAPP